MNQPVKNKTILAQLEALISDESNWIANLSNASALLNQHFHDINWVGFYLWDENDQQLILGPFQGQVACIRIDSGKGVCGTAFSKKETIIVPDTNEFPGHIVCDSRSQSEIVIPLIKNGKRIGVLDVDAPIKNRFTESDKILLEDFATSLME
ncbi:MAG: GAF domain-containing protein, partial [Atopostipes suicloacalis]|nr:GAF domain-containing protein [Atopostipes suicloacalis]